jgi:hypothetical protein
MLQELAGVVTTVPMDGTSSRIPIFEVERTLVSTALTTPLPHPTSCLV